MDILVDVTLKTWEMSADISRFLHDVQKVIGLDHTLLGTAVDVRITGNRSSLSEDNEPLCGIQVFMEADYRFNRSDPSTPV